MKLAVSYDKHGEIFTLFDPAKLHTGEGFHTYVPAKGEQHHVLEVPKDLENKSLEELPRLLRVNASGAHPQFENKA